MSAKIEDIAIGILAMGLLCSATILAALEITKG